MTGRMLIIWCLWLFTTLAVAANEETVVLGVKLVASDRSGTLSWRLGEAATVKSPDKKLQDDLSAYLGLNVPVGAPLPLLPDAVASEDGGDQDHHQQGTRHQRGRQLVGEAPYRRGQQGEPQPGFRKNDPVIPNPLIP